jgi:hypothetical protein
MDDSGTALEIRWLSVFADVPAERVERALAYWAAITATAPGPADGDAGQYLPLEPTAGDRYLWVQRVGRERPGWHLDLHVPDPEAAARRAQQLGATPVRAAADLVVLRTPAGLPFCLVAERAGPPRCPPEAPAWPGGPSRLDQLSLDVPAERFDGECAFWATLTGWPLRGRDDEFDRLRMPATLPVQFLLQSLRPDDREGAHAHPDFSADDRDAEVARHQRLGAEVVRRTNGWTTLRDPVGLVYCVTERRTGVRVV